MSPHADKGTELFDQTCSPFTKWEKTIPTKGLQCSVPTGTEVSYNLLDMVSILDSAYEVIQTNHCLELDSIAQEWSVR